MRQSRNRSARHRQPQPETDRLSLYDEVTARIIAELEAGRAPWVQPWGTGGASGPALPRNAVTARAYSGINVLILWGAVIAQGYPSQAWLTFKQARDAGGCVMKGERGTCVVYADRFTPEAERERARASGETARAIPFLKRFTVFNLAQCDGLSPDAVKGAVDPAPLPEREIVPVSTPASTSVFPATTRSCRPPASDRHSTGLAGSSPSRASGLGGSTWAASIRR